MFHEQAEDYLGEGALAIFAGTPKPLHRHIDQVHPYAIVRQGRSPCEDIEDILATDVQSDYEKFRPLVLWEPIQANRSRSQALNYHQCRIRTCEALELFIRADHWGWSWAVKVTGSGRRSNCSRDQLYIGVLA